MATFTDCRLCILVPDRETGFVGSNNEAAFKRTRSCDTQSSSCKRRDEAVIHSCADSCPNGETETGFEEFVSLSKHFSELLPISGLVNIFGPREFLCAWLKL